MAIQTKKKKTVQPSLLQPPATSGVLPQFNPGQHPLSPFAQQAVIGNLRDMQRKFMGTPNPPAPPPMAPESPTVEKMMNTGEGPSAYMYNRMQGARSQGLAREKMTDLMGPPAPSAAPPPAPGVARVAPGMAPYQPPAGGAPQGGLDPNAKAIIDSMTGARVHKDMSGRQMGMAGVDPNLRYMLYAMRGRRHKSMGGQDIY